MQIFAKWENGVPVTCWTLSVPRRVTKCKKFIQETLIEKKCDLPKYIKYVKTCDNQHIYVILFTDNCEITKDHLHSLFPSSSKDSDSVWKWRTYWHTFNPWEETEDELDEDIKSFTQYHEAQSESESDEEENTEMIPVYDYIMEETELNPHHMTTTFPIQENKLHVTMHEICKALSDVDMNKLIGA